MSLNTAFAQPITRFRLHEEIVAIIQKQIMNGTILPGTKLPPEREMSETFNVNRTTLREALHKLETLELLEIRHGDGVYAKHFLESGNLDLIKTAVSMDGNNETFLNVMEARLTIVPEIAALAAQRRTAAELAEIKLVIDRDDLPIAERDINIHHMIVRATHNLVYTIMLNFLISSTATSVSFISITNAISSGLASSTAKSTRPSKTRNQKPLAASCRMCSCMRNKP
jgi:GntR family transcriptional repressor for pyruvate dehydrogenase complex